MKTRRISFEVEVPDEATNADILRWARFHLGEVADLPKSPMSDVELEAIYNSTRIER